MFCALICRITLRLWLIDWGDRAERLCTVDFVVVVMAARHNCAVRTAIIFSADAYFFLPSMSFLSPNLGGRLANRHQTLSHICSKIGGPSLRKIVGLKTSTFLWDFRQLSDVIAIFGKLQDINHGKTALETTITPASAHLIWITLALQCSVYTAEGGSSSNSFFTD